MIPANDNALTVLDLFSAAAGGWSLGMHRAGFRTIAACEVIPWRRAVYSSNNPGVPVYDDVTTLTAERLVRDGVGLPWAIVGSPPCQDISPANTKGEGVDGARSGLYFEAIRLVGECRPRWFAFENSANLRTRGADRVIPELEALGYAVWPFVVRASDVGANHERGRSWVIGFNADAAGQRHEGGWPRGHWPYGDGAARDASCTGVAADTDQARQQDGQVESCLRKAPQPIFGCNDGRRREVADAAREVHSSGQGEVGICLSNSSHPVSEQHPWSLASLARHLRMDNGLSSWVAGTRIAVGGPRGTSAASLIVEAFGDAVVPQIPEAIGRAILRVEAALSCISLQRRAA